MTTPGKPELATNRAGQTVAEVVSEFVRNAAGVYVGGAHLDIATAYFNLEGYSLLADALDELNGVRLLLGAEPTPPENKKRRLGIESSKASRAARKRLSEALQKHEHAIVDDWQLLGFSQETDESAKRLVGWLRSGKVEVRRLQDRFLHGKAFIVGTQTHGLLAGSSNFTRAGLTTNLELNIGNYTPRTVTQVQEWFDEIWDAAEPYDLARCFEERFEPHHPYLIYLRMLWERYGDELEEERQAEGAPQIHLTDFQTDGLWRARRFLKHYNGVLIADEVGLGKTFLAGELISEAALDRRQHVLVVAPATLRDGPWNAFRSEFNLPFDLVSFEELAADVRLISGKNRQRSHTTKLPIKDVNQYAMVVVDEAHNLRNPSTRRADALRRLLSKAPPKQLVLVTATPVNNSLWDLYHLLGYFLRNDAVFAGMGIKSLRDHFHKAMRLSVDDLSPEHLFDVLDAVAVRRTRSFVKHHYPGATIKLKGREQEIVFPTPRVRKVSYDLDGVLPGFFERLAAALDPENPDDPDALTLARYRPSLYRLDNDWESYEQQLVGLMRSWLLKRFESSPHAFASTCSRMAETHDAFLSLLELGLVATGEALADWVATDSDDMDAVEDYLESKLSVTEPASQAFSGAASRGGGGESRAGGGAESRAGGGEPANPRSAHPVSASEYDVASLAAAVAHDRDMLRSFVEEASSVERADDPNLIALVEELAVIASEAASVGIGEADTRNKRKVLIFSYYADTVEWIYDHLLDAVGSDPRLACYEGRIAWLSGSSGGGGDGGAGGGGAGGASGGEGSDSGGGAGGGGAGGAGDGAYGGGRSRGASGGGGSKESILYGFAPLTTDAPEGRDDDLYDIVVTTDVLSEGVNLQQARHIINYDLPWNPMRLVQRHGRIDRIGSMHNEVFIRCVFPDALLDKLLGLEESLQLKIAQAAASIGVGEVLPGQAPVNINYSETREEIERLRREEAYIFERGGTGRGVLSGEEYRQELRRALEDSNLASQIKGLQWGSGSGMGGSSSVARGSGSAAGYSDSGMRGLGSGTGYSGSATGYVFCIRVGDWPQPIFRYVEYPGAGNFRSQEGGSQEGLAHEGRGMAHEGRLEGLPPESAAFRGKPTLRHGGVQAVVDETLICLDRAHPPEGFKTPRVLTEQTATGVFAAWETAQADVVEKWNLLADKANLEPKLPREQERAAAILRSHAPPDLTQEEVDRALDTVCAPYPERTIRTFRAARQSSDDPRKQAEAILGVIEDLGLEPYAPPEPLPEITKSDVYLVCWLAIA